MNQFFLAMSFLHILWLRNKVSLMPFEILEWLFLARPFMMPLWPVYMRLSPLPHHRQIIEMLYHRESAERFAEFQFRKVLLSSSIGIYFPLPPEPTSFRQVQPDVCPEVDS